MGKQHAIEAWLRCKDVDSRKNPSSPQVWDLAHGTAVKSLAGTLARRVV
jgi:hypothetical protein